MKRTLLLTILLSLAVAQQGQGDRDINCEIEARNAEILDKCDS